MKGTILIVDDDRDLCKLLSMYLRKIGYTTTCLHALNDVEFHLQDNPILILLDNQLDDGIGLDFISHFKRSCPDVPIVLMTADYVTDLKKKADFVCIDGLLLKPFTTRSLDQVLERIAA
jgi:DNA-binding response OmpR family regulator